MLLPVSGFHLCVFTGEHLGDLVVRRCEENPDKLDLAGTSVLSPVTLDQRQPLDLIVCGFSFVS